LTVAAHTARINTIEFSHADARMASGGERDRERFFDNQRGVDSDLFEHMAWYICKMDTGGKRRANHFHCLFLFDASKVNDVNGLANRIGQRWNEVTGGQGLMYNCHLSPDKSELVAKGKWALDPLDRGDAKQYAKLEDYVLDYFTKDKGQMVRVKPTARARTLTMGRMPEVRLGGTGRPRTM
jgi:hypothetical protein